MSNLAISIRRRTLSDRSCAFDVELHQYDQTINLPCYSREEAEQLMTTLAGVIEACACVNVEAFQFQ